MFPKNRVIFPSDDESRPSGWFPLCHMLCLSCDALSCYRKSGLSLVWFKYGWRLPFCTLLNLLLPVICASWVVFFFLLMGLSLVLTVIQKEPKFSIGSRCRIREERTHYWVQKKWRTLLGLDVFRFVKWRMCRCSLVECDHENCFLCFLTEFCQNHWRWVRIC